MNGDVIQGSVMAGQVSGMIKTEETCQNIIDSLGANYTVAFSRLEKFNPSK